MADNVEGPVTIKWDSPTQYQQCQIGAKPMKKNSILIVKHGYSSTCDRSVSPLVHIDDVFVCTCLLEEFRGWDVTWITSLVSKDILRGNYLIDKLIFAESPEHVPPDQMLGHYDVVVNLEKQRDWCQYAGSISADEHYGFEDWAGSGDECLYSASQQGLSHHKGFRPIQERLYELVGRQWRGQRYILGYQPDVVEIYDVGLNHHASSKCSNKSWPGGLWHVLYDNLSKGHAVCWQNSVRSVRAYINWLASCRLIVACDCLGLHLAAAMNKKVVGLFGPTPPEAVYLYGCGVKLTPTCNRPCVPCMQDRCPFDEPCMEFIQAELVQDTIEMLLAGELADTVSTGYKARDHKVSEIASLVGASN